MGDNSAETLSRLPLPKVAFCGKRQRLLDAFWDAMQQLTMLRDQVVAAIISGYDDFARFDLLIGIAQQKKNQAKDAFMCHVEKHGC
jgi:hypothetical protein